MSRTCEDAARSLDDLLAAIPVGDVPPAVEPDARGDYVEEDYRGEDFTGYYRDIELEGAL